VCIDESVKKILIVEVYPCGEDNCGRSAGSLVDDCIANPEQDQWCCEGHSAGHLCRSCEKGFYPKESELGGGECAKCGISASSIFIVVPVLIVLVALTLNHPRVKVKVIAWAATIRELTTNAQQDKSYESVQHARAIFRSSWQPLRIIISYSQIAAQVGYNLDIDFPSSFMVLLNGFKAMFVFNSWIPGAECASLDGFLFKWVFSVIVVPAVLLVIVLIDWLVNPKRRVNPVDARKDFLANSFFVVFFM
jgi:hypothetical protein